MNNLVVILLFIIYFYIFKYILLFYIYYLFTEKLPKGSYCSFISNDICGWSNGDNNDNSVGKWVIEHNDKSSYIKADFLQSTTPFGRSITIKSPTFQHIPLYHSQHNSAYFNSCLVSKSIIID